MWSHKEMTDTILDSVSKVFFRWGEERMSVVGSYIYIYTLYIVYIAT